MIQRKQTIYMLVAILLLCSLMLFPIDTFAAASGIYEFSWRGIFDVTDLANSILIERLWPVTVLLLIPLALNLFSIFLYKHRPIQMRLTGIACGIELGLCGVIVFMSYMTCQTLNSNFHFALSFLAPIAAAVLDFMAYRSISDDEELVRSLERLR